MDKSGGDIGEERRELAEILGSRGEYQNLILVQIDWNRL